jgi:hypothetical protein
MYSSQLITHKAMSKYPIRVSACTKTRPSLFRTFSPDGATIPQEQQNSHNLMFVEMEIEWGSNGM